MLSTASPSMGLRFLLGEGGSVSADVLSAGMPYIVSYLSWK